MYILMWCPPIIPGLMLFPVLLALINDKERSDTQLTSLAKKITIGFFGGTILYFAIYFLFNTLFEEETMGWYQKLGFILPILFGLWIIYSKTYEEVKSNTLKVKSFSAGVIYIVFIAPYFLFFILFFEDLLTATALLIPGLAGLWLASMTSMHTKKYFAIHIVLALISVIAFALIIFGFSSM